MLVKCPTCNVEFSPALGRCPRCGTWEPAQEETDEYMINHIGSELSEGRSVRQVREQLLARGYDADVADDLISSARCNLRSIHRRLGTQLALKGILLIGASAVLFVLALGTVLFYGALVFGLALLVIGVLKAWTGWTIE